MKRLINLLVLVAFMAVSVIAQDKQVTPQFFKGASDYYTTLSSSQFNLTVADSVSSADSTWSARIGVPFSWAHYYDIRVSLDSTSGTPTAPVVLKGRKNSSDTWTTITTVTWTGTTSDTTFYFTENTNVKFYTDYLIDIDCEATTAQKFAISSIDVKFHK